MIHFCEGFMRRLTNVSNNADQYARAVIRGDLGDLRQIQSRREARHSRATMGSWWIDWQQQRLDQVLLDTLRRWQAVARGDGAGTAHREQLISIGMFHFSLNTIGTFHRHRILFSHASARPTAAT